MKNTILAGAMALALMTGANAAFSQCQGVVWPENPEMRAKAEESKVLYEDAVKADQFKQALKPWNWMLKNVPNHGTSLYIYGADIYDNLASKEKDPARKAVLVDSLMIIYDLRIKTCGDEAAVYNRKALSYLKFNANDKPEESLKMLDRAFELSGNDILDGTIIPYFQMVRLNKLKFKTMTDEELLERYDKLQAIIDAKIKEEQSKGKSVEKLQKIKATVDDILPTTGIQMDCDFVKTKLEPKFRQNPTDMDLAKKIFSFMLKGKCTDDPLWLETAELIHNNGTKDCGLAKNLGIIYITKQDFEKAEKYLKEAQTICTEGSDKADVLLYLGSLEAKRGRGQAARDLYRQAIAADASVAKKAYESIGDLYLNSFDACKKLKSHVDDRLVYLLAFDYYQKAGDARKMAVAKEGFPSKTEIFEENIKVGTSKNVECWGESTTIRTRD